MTVSNPSTNGRRLTSDEAINQADELARLRQENAALQARLEAGNVGLSLGVSEKGAVSLYGLMKQFPLTLYAEQWLKVFEKQPAIMAYIAKNRQWLKAKNQDADSYVRNAAFEGKLNSNGTVSAKRTAI